MINEFFRKTLAKKRVLVMVPIAVVLIGAVAMFAFLLSCKPGDAAVDSEPATAVEDISPDEPDETEDNGRAAVVEDLAGSVTALTDGDEIPAFKGLALLRRDTVGTGAESWTSLELAEGQFVLIEENSDVLIEELADSAGSAEITLRGGKIWIGITEALSDEATFTVKTPNSAMSVRGTFFAVEHKDGVTAIPVYEGTVSVETEDEAFDVSLGAAEIAGEDAGAAQVQQRELDENDWAPLMMGGDDGPGGIYAKLRGLAPPSTTFIEIKGERYSTDLTELDLYEMGLTDEDIVPLQYMTNLVRLRLHVNNISDISPLSSLTNLESLVLAGNQISDITPLSSLNLIVLHSGSNKISDISPLSGMTTLQEIALEGNQISDISSISQLTNLTNLLLPANQINDISPLSGLFNLTELWLSGNQITDISPLPGLLNLTELNLGFNQITNISPLSGLTNLEEVELTGNPITDWSPVAHVPNVEGRP